MNSVIYEYLNMLVRRYPALAHLQDTIAEVYRIMEDSFAQGGKLLIAGNGGSSADAEHIVGELMKGFLLPRKMDDDTCAKLQEIDPELGNHLAQHLQGALPAIALHGQYALTTAYGNDCNPQMCFAQQVNGYGNAGDVFLGISTSGNSGNVLYAAITAKARGMRVVGITGERESRLSAIADACIRVPGTEAFQVQEYHLPIYHCICMMLEARFFGA